MVGAFTITSKIDDRDIVAALDRLHAKVGRMAPAMKKYRRCRVGPAEADNWPNALEGAKGAR